MNMFIKKQSNLVKGNGCASFRLHVIATACFCAVFLTAQSGCIATKDQKVKETMNAALNALGGADKIGSINSLILNGTENVFINGTELPDSKRIFEIWMLLPDNFVKIDSRGSGRQTALGVSQGKRLPAPVSIATGKVRETNKAVLNAIVDELRDEWAFILLGMLAKTGPATLKITFGSTSDIFTLITKNGTSGEIEFDIKNWCPSVVRYRNTRLASDNEIRFQDRFSVNGIMFPRTIIMVDSKAERRLNVDAVQVNPKLSLKDFEQFAVAPKLESLQNVKD
jgi:hypothetical protein